MSRHSFLESTVRGFARALSRALVSEQTAKRRGLLQSLDPRVRVVGLLSLVVAVTLSRRIPVVAALFVLALALALASRISLRSLVTRVWLIVFAFTGIIALPAIFITPGAVVASFPALHLAVTAQGLRTAALLILRVETAATLTTTLVLATSWTHILKALRSLRLPPEVVTMLAMTHRYIFLLIETATQMFESRQSRMVGALPTNEQRRMAARTAGVLLGKSIDLSNEVYMAMRSRGFRGEVHVLSGFRMRAWDYAALAVFLGMGFAAMWAGR
jgi:cobalt/nickel transport system permease protein